MMTQNRPKTGDYASFYGKYIALVPEGEFLQILETQLRDWQRLLGDLSEEQSDFRYEPGKWSIKEMLGHVSDSERIFCIPAAAHCPWRSDADGGFRAG